jgi:transcription initiation factor TFIIB
MMDPVHEGRAFTAEDYAARARTGPAASLVMHDRGLSTVIGNDRDSTGRSLSSRSKMKFSRLRTWDQRSKSRSTASMSRAFVMMNSITTKLTIPSIVVERAAYIYRKALAAGLTKGRTVASLAAASVYVACRETGTPRTLDDMAATANVEKRVLYRDMRRLLARLDLKPDQYKISAFVVKISNNLGLSESIKRDALEILKRSEEMLVTAGKNPVAMASAAIYISCINNETQMSQRMLSKQAGVSDVTVRNSVAVIRDALGI